MKKSLILASLLAFTMLSSMANAEPPCPSNTDLKPPMHKGKMMPTPDAKKMEAKRAEFENKLQLTEEQKIKAKEIRLKGHEEMKPIMEQMKAKKVQIDAVLSSGISEEEKLQKIAPIKEEMKNLKKQARDLRIKNLQEFESILTAKQKKILEKMKQEGRKNFKKQHPHKCKPQAAK